MLMIPIAILLLLAMIAVAWSPLLAVIAVGVLFASFLAYAWHGPMRSTRGTAGRSDDRAADDAPRSRRGIQMRPRHAEGRLRHVPLVVGEGPCEGAVRRTGRSRASRY